jgi:hypothetical protein
MRIDPGTWRVTSWGYWLCYVPQDFKAARDRGAPNYASIRDLAFLSDESIAFSGQAATGLIQTPGAFFEYRRDGEKHGGSFAALQSPDQRALLFSSYLPGCEDARVAAGRQGRLLVASRSTGLMRHPSGDVPSPVLRAPQDRCRGPADGHLILIQAPGAAP